MNQHSSISPMARSCGIVHRRYASPAFSLVEMLVTVSIIGLLIVLTLPVIQTVRKAANAAKCASNLHHLGSAVQTYVSDNNGFLPSPLANAAYLQEQGLPTDRAVSSSFRLMLPLDALATYMDGTKINSDASITTDISRKLACPEAKWPGYFSTTSKNSMRAMGYAGNPAVIPWSTSVWARYGALHVGRIARTSQVILFADSGQKADGSTLHMIDWLQYDEFSNPTKATAANANKTVTDSLLAAKTLVEGQTLFQPRHKDRGNCLFVDGHVEALLPSEIREMNIYRGY